VDGGWWLVDGDLWLVTCVLQQICLPATSNRQPIGGGWWMVACGWC